MSEYVAAFALGSAATLIMEHYGIDIIKKALQERFSKTDNNDEEEENKPCPKCGRRRPGIRGKK